MTHLAVIAEVDCAIAACRQVGNARRGDRLLDDVQILFVAGDEHPDVVVEPHLLASQMR